MISSTLQRFTLLHFPQRLSGANLESLAALQDVLKAVIIFSFTLPQVRVSSCHGADVYPAILHIAPPGLYALGGIAAIIRDYYKHDSEAQRPVIRSPWPITEAEDNFVDHLEDEE